MSNDREQLIMKLREIQKNRFKVEKAQDAWEYIPLMLDYIGDIDPVLRDELIYDALCEWITEKEYFDEAHLRQILTTLMDDNHLFYQIGSDGDDSVFTRTFSILGVVRILYMHRKKAFLSMNEFIDLKNKLIEYYISEKDLRGEIPVTGWAHGGAHGADVLDELVQCCESNESVVQEVLNAFKKVMYNGKYILCEEEDERISVVVFRIIKMKLISNQSMINWLNELTECIEWQRDRMQYVTRVNSKNFIRCLYFKVMHYDNKLDIIGEIFKIEEKLNRSFLLNKSLIEQ